MINIQTPHSIFHFKIQRKVRDSHQRASGEFMSISKVRVSLPRERESGALKFQKLGKGTALKGE